MVEAGIITEDQAYSMMGVDETTSSSMPRVATGEMMIRKRKIIQNQ